ncbi:hypothetical protein, partial [Escherichia coli]|uniref:hypothetical protein n=1 Tax=Escherichia coli TaxID=562 RepID=UPI001BC8432D
RSVNRMFMCSPLIQNITGTHLPCGKHVPDRVINDKTAGLHYAFIASTVEDKMPCATAIRQGA